MAIKVWWTEYSADEYLPRRIMPEAGLLRSPCPGIYECPEGWAFDGRLFADAADAMAFAERRYNLRAERPGALSCIVS